MRVIPTSSAEWSTFLLFPFKAYSVLGILGFLIWHAVYYKLHSHDWHSYEQVGVFIMVGYMFAAGVLLFGGLLQITVLKSKAATSSFIFGIIDIGIAVIIPAFFPA